MVNRSVFIFCRVSFLHHGFAYLSKFLWGLGHTFDFEWCFRGRLVSSATSVPCNCQVLVKVIILFTLLCCATFGRESFSDTTGGGFLLVSIVIKDYLY